ncbi:hypothetical protein THIX_10451 [Thiomonas sp. X19]|nr:hypothetical protein THIX_10451 [Thiomonas sp. X19]
MYVPRARAHTASCQHTHAYHLSQLDDLDVFPGKIEPNVSGYGVPGLATQHKTNESR